MRGITAKLISFLACDSRIASLSEIHSDLLNVCSVYNLNTIVEALFYCTEAQISIRIA